MALEDMRDVPCNPSDACRFWKFNSRGEIFWTKTQFRGAKFVWRKYKFQEGELNEYRKDKNRAVIVEVRAPGIPRHWVYYADDVICDPLTGALHTELPTKYKPIGYALFQSEPIPPSPWAKEFIEKAYDKGLAANSPFSKIENIQKIEETLFDMKLIDKKTGAEHMTLERFVTMLDKVAHRW